MPKIVDHQQRKEQIAEAVWRIVRKDGLDGATVRRVADETGVSVGSLRHYFDTQHELLAFAMRLLAQRVRARIRRLAFSGEPLRDILLMIGELVPLDAERLAEAEVWLAFAAKGISDPAIRALSREVHEELYGAFRGAISLLASSGLAADGLDIEVETRRLHALVDGLAVHYSLFPAEANQVEPMRIVERHLNALLRTPAGDESRG